MSKKASNKSKGRQKTASSHPHTRPSPTGKVPPAKSLRRVLSAALVATFLAVAGLAVALYSSSSAPVHEVVTPQGFEDVEPQLKAHLSTLLEACRSQPNNIDARISLGQAFEANKYWDEALRTYRTVVAMDPKQKLARFHLALALDATDAFDQAMDEWRRLLADYPDFAPAHARLGDRLLDKGQLPEAAQAFQRVIDLLPTAPQGYVGLGDAQLRMGRPEAAVPLLERAIQLKPGYKTAHYLLGLAFRELRRVDEVRRELAKGADAHRQYLPDEWTSTVASHARRLDDLTVRAQELAQAGRAPEAIRLLENLLTWQPNHIILLNNLAGICLQAKRWDQAATLLQRAEGLEDTHFATLINLSSWAIRTGQPSLALTYADRAVESAPNVAQSYVTRYHALRGLDHLDSALLDLQQALRLDVKDPRIAVELANQYMMANLPAQALPQYTEAIRRDPFQVTPYLGLCESNAMLGRFQDAASALAEAERVAPGNPQIAAARRRLQQARNQ